MLPYLIPRAILYAVFNRKQKFYVFLHLYFPFFRSRIVRDSWTRIDIFYFRREDTVRSFWEDQSRLNLEQVETAKSITRNQIVNHDPCVICPIISYRAAFDPHRPSIHNRCVNITRIISLTWMIYTYTYMCVWTQNRLSWIIVPISEPVLFSDCNEPIVSLTRYLFFEFLNLRSVEILVRLD